MNTPRIAAVAAALCLSASAFAQTVVNAPSNYPISIGTPGTYKLNADLAPPAGTIAIDVTVAGVTIDLNGHTITGSSTVCTQTQYSWATTCTGSSAGTASGIRGGDTLIVRNGTIRGFSRGIDIAGGRIEDVTLRFNNQGVWQSPVGSSANSLPLLNLKGVVAEWNTYAGAVLFNANVRDSSFKGNSYGVQGSTWVTLIDSVVSRNAIGVASSAIHGTRVFDNQQDFYSGTAGY